MTRGRDRADDGVTLIEVMVTMAVMSVVMAVFTTGILQVYRSILPAESAAGAQAELRRVYQRLDKEVRYASWIAPPGKVGTVWYVEFAALGTECGQLRLDTVSQVLRLVRWTAGSPPSAGPVGLVLGSQLLVDGGEPPFKRQEAGSMPYASASPALDAGTGFAPDHQRLRVHLAATVGSSTSRLGGTFTALNTSRDTTGTNACSEGRP